MARIPKRSRGPFRVPRRAGGPLAVEGVLVASLPEGPNPQKVLRTFPGIPPGRGTACGGRSLLCLPPRGRCRGLPRRKEFRLPVVSLARILSPMTPSVAYGASSLERELNRGPLAVEGVFVASLPEGPNPQKALRTFPGTPPGRGTACGGRSPRCLPPRGRCRGLPRRKESSLPPSPRARIPKRSSGPFRGPRRAGGSRSETEGVLLASLPEGGVAACRDGRSPRCLPLEGGGSRSETEGVRLFSARFLL